MVVSAFCINSILSCALPRLYLDVGSFEPVELLECNNPEKEYDDAYHLASLMPIMQPPPLEFLKSSPIS